MEEERKKEKGKKKEEWKQVDELHESTYTTYFFHHITIPCTDGLTICDWLNSPTWNSTQRRPVSCEVTCGLSTTLRVGIPKPLYVIQESSVSIHISNTQNEKESYTMTNL